MMNLIDSHCHIDLYPNPEQLLKEVERHRILTVAVTNLPSHFQIGYPHFRSAKWVRPALGLHPLLANQHSTQELTTFRKLLPRTSYIGEVGLDFTSEGKETLNRQIESLRFVLESIATKEHKFVSLHSRRAESTVLEMLDEFQVAGAVFHWYSGPLSLLDQLVVGGHYVSINPAMIRSQGGKKIIEQLPKESILTETDGPHLQIGNRPAQPQDVEQVLRFLSGLWCQPLHEVSRQIYKNFRRAVGTVI